MEKRIDVKPEESASKVTAFGAIRRKGTRLNRGFRPRGGLEGMPDGPEDGFFMSASFDFFAPQPETVQRQGRGLVLCYALENAFQGSPFPDISASTVSPAIAVCPTETRTAAESGI